MALTNILLLSQIAGHVIAFILSLCVVVPMSMQQSEFRGHCLLFSSGIWQEADGQLKVDWASQCYCNYTIFVGVLLGLVSVFQIYRTRERDRAPKLHPLDTGSIHSLDAINHGVTIVKYMESLILSIQYPWFSLFLYKGTDSSFLSAFIDVVSGILLCGMVIIAALMITLGFMAWCENMTERFPSCELAAGQEIDKKDGINTKNFYIELGTAQFGVWGSFTTWVGLSVCALIKLCRYHQIENIRVSMYIERQRLINENADSPGSSLGRESNQSETTATAE